MKFKKIILVICLSTVTTLLISSSEIYADKNPINTVYKSLTNGKLIKPAHLSQNTTTSFDIILKPKISPLKTASEVNTPGSANFKQFITPGTLAKTYGQSTAIINRWTRFLKKKHLKVTNFNNIVLNVNGKAKNIDNTFKVDINTAKYHHDPLQFGKRRPRFNKTLQNSVWFLSGLTDHNPNYRLPADSGFASSSSNSHPGFTKRFTDRYNVTPLYRKGLTGSGQTIGIIAFGNLRKTNAFHFWRHEKASTDPERLSIKRVTGPQTHPRLVSNDELETTMDTEYAGSVAPNANIKVYLVSDALPSITNMINAYLTAFHQNTASSLSNSWGLSYGSNYAQLLKQHLVSPHFKQLLDLVLSQGALQGISSFTEAGDYGALNLASTKSSYRKRTLLDINTSSADVLSANPWITSLGGTTLPFKGDVYASGQKLGRVTVKKERSWGNDYIWPLLQQHSSFLAKNPYQIVESINGGGGGFDHDYATPSYQLNVPGVNTFNARNYLSNLGQQIYNQPLLSGHNYGRNYPDMSADADLQTGYWMYQQEKGESPWNAVGGTSIVSPQYAAVAALINSAPNHARMGFWNPQIYQLAQSSNSPFTPLNATTDNSNLYYTGQPGKLYNQASGLGTTNFAKLFAEYK